MKITGRGTALTCGSVTTLVLGPAAIGQITFDWPRYVEDEEWVSGENFAVADFDRDGFEDVAIARLDVGAEILRNSGSGVFSHFALVGTGSLEYGPELQAVDIDGDDDFDLVWAHYEYQVGSTLYLALNDGSGLDWTVIDKFIPGYVNDFDLGDIDGDSDVDIVSETYDRLWVMEFEDGAFGDERVIFDRSADELDPNDIIFGDIDRDGDLDVISLDADGYGYQPRYSNGYYKCVDSEVVVLINDSQGGITPREIIRLPYRGGVTRTPHALELGDFDGDGDADIAIVVGNTHFDYQDNPGELCILENVNTGQEFTVRLEQPVGHGDAHGIEVADLDSDGRADILLTSDLVTGVYVLRNKPFVGFEREVLFPSGIPEAKRIVARDVTGDGQLDILTYGRRDFGPNPNRLAVLNNLTLIDNPRLTTTPLIRDTEAEISIEGLPSNALVWVGATRAGFETTVGFGVFGGLTLDLAMPLDGFVRVRADASGRAEARWTVPRDCPIGPIHFQGAVRLGAGGRDSIKTPPYATVVRD